MDAAHPPAPLEFGRFRVVRHRRELLVDGRAVELGGRAFDTLIALIDARGSIVDKDRLMRRVWPDRVVEENNLQAQISALRKVFGADRDLIRTVAGRGYQFTGDIRDAETAVTPPAGLTNLPSHLPDLIGRDASLGTVVDLITAHRLVTLTGAGGVGKTRLALEAARRLLPRFPDGVWLVELGPLADPALVPVTVATAVGLPLGTAPVTADRVAGALREKHLLLVLDNCEHMIDAAASMAAALVSAGALARVLATTLEPLRAPEEHVYRVPSLDVPAEDNLDADDVSRYGAIRLFDVRARAAEPGYVADRRRAATVAAICRRLDGIPLAIELAAARVPAFGVDGIAARLGDRFHLLTGGRRTALPRQQTLRATLDWSYELLSEPERITLRRLAVFAGGFSLEAATAVVSSPDLPASEVSDCVAGLVSRSLVSAHAGELSMQYRLLETTRAYAREELSASGELATLARRHAEYFGALFEQGNTELGTRPVTEWMAAYGKQIDDVRAALDWAFSSSRDVAAGVALTIAVVPLWTHLSLMEECRRRVEQALGCLGPAASRDRRREMQLLAALGAALMYTKGAVPETRSAFAGTLEIADRLDDTDYRLRALWGLWVDRMNSGDVRQAMTLAETFSRAAAKSTDPLAAPVGDRMTGFALHFLGDQTQARRHIERMLDGPRPSVHELHIVRFQFDPWVTARSRLATILWLQGHPDQAVSTAQRGVEEAVALNHAVTLCNAFAHGACSVAFLAGHLAGGCSERCCRGRGTLPAVHRLGATPGRALLGAAGLHEPRPALARTAAREPGANAALGRLPPVHRGVWNCRSRQRESPARQAPSLTKRPQHFSERFRPRQGLLSPDCVPCPSRRAGASTRRAEMTSHRAGSDGVERNIQKFLGALAAGGGKPMEQMTPAEARAVLVGAQSSVTLDLPKADVTERTIATDGQTVKLVIVRPTGVTGALPVFMFFHGGGWVLGDFPTHERLVRDLVAGSGAAAAL